MGIPTCVQVVHRENPLLKDPTNVDNVQLGKVPYDILTCLGEGKERRLLLKGIYTYIYLWIVIPESAFRTTQRIKMKRTLFA